MIEISGVFGPEVLVGEYAEVSCLSEFCDEDRPGSYVVIPLKGEVVPISLTGIYQPVEAKGIYGLQELTGKYVNFPMVGLYAPVEITGIFNTLSNVIPVVDEDFSWILVL